MRLGLGLGIPALQGGGFSPAALFAGGEAGAWYEPGPATCFTDAARTTPAGNGDPVGGMLDLSGNGNHLTQSTAAARPTLTQSGALWYLAFDGIDDGLTSPSITPGTDKAQVFAGVEKISDVNAGTAVEFGPNGFASAGGFYMRAPNSATGNNYAFATQNSAYTVTGFAAPNKNVLSMLLDLSQSTLAGEITPRIDGAVTRVGPFGSGAATGNFSTYALNIGSRTSTNVLTGNIYSLVLRFGPVLSADQIVQVEEYTAAKTGLTL